MSEETGKSNPNWLGLAPNLEHFDPFEGLSERVSEEELKHIRYGFRIAGQNLLFEKTVPCEAIQNSLIYPVPNTPVWLSGLINLRGNLIPVIDLSSLISAQNGDRPETGRKTLLIIDRNEDIIGTFIDGLPVALQIDEDTVETVDNFDDAPELFRDRIRTAYRVDESIWYEVDHKSLFRQLTTEISGSDTVQKGENVDAVV